MFLEIMRQHNCDASSSRHFGKALRAALAGEMDNRLSPFVSPENPEGLFLIRMLIADKRSPIHGWINGLLVRCELTEDDLAVEWCDMVGMKSVKLSLDAFPEFAEYTGPGAPAARHDLVAMFAKERKSKQRKVYANPITSQHALDVTIP